MPVMIPGRAIGSSSSSDTAFLPKALRHRAPAASVPSTKAMAVDRAAILSDTVPEAAPGRLAEPAQRQPLRRKAKSCIFRIKSIDGDNQQRKVEEYPARVASRRYRARVQSASKAPRRFTNAR